MTLNPADIAHWRQWIGKTEHATQILDAESLRRFAAAIGEDLDVERVQPSLGHWAWFLPTVGREALGADGHPERGGFLPPVSLPTRMFGASDIRFDAPLELGVAATRQSRVVAIDHRAGRSGDLVTVEVEHEIEQAGRVRVGERQTIVYRGSTAPVAAVVPVDLDATDDRDALWRPTAVDLFRFSAATFNSHRIHYDAPYATSVENYPALVVQGPFVAARLFGFARRRHHAFRGFSFRASLLLFVDQPVRLRQEEGSATVEAVRCDGAVSMTARTSS